MAVTQETIDQYRRLPHTIARLRREVLAAPTLRDAEAAYMALRAEDEYRNLPCRQDETRGQGHSLFYVDREVIDEVILLNQFNDIETELSKSFNQVQKSDIHSTTVHPTSLTFALSDQAFRYAWNLVSPDDTDRVPLGFTATDLRLSLGIKSIPFSLRNADTSDESTSEHENEHVVYRYTHPYRVIESELFPTWEALEMSARGACDTGDMTAFRHDLDFLSTYYLGLYLDELNASTPKRYGVLDQFTGSDGHYVKYRAKALAAIRQGLPDDIFESLPWEKAIWDENTKLEHRMKFIDKEFRTLVEHSVPTEELQNIIHALTPDQAYMIRAFNLNYAETPPRGVYKWAREYLNGWTSRDYGRRVNDATEFLMTTLSLGKFPTSFYDIEDSMYAQLDARRRKIIYGEDSYPEREYLNITDTVFTEDSLEVFISEIRSLIKDRLEKIQKLASVPHTDLGLDDEEAEETREQVINQTLNLSQIFSNFLTEAGHHVYSLKFTEFKRIQSDPELREAYVKAQKPLLIHLARRSLQLHDASTALRRAVHEGKEVDLETLFSPEYRKSDEEYERELAFLTDTTFGEPIINQRLSTLTSADHLGVREDDTTIYLYSPSYFATTVVSLMRVLLWAKETDRTGEEIDMLRDALMLLKSKSHVPREYYPLLADEDIIPIEEDTVLLPIPEITISLDD